MRVHDADGAVAALAASQHGAFTRRQAAAVGMTAKMLLARRRAGVLREPHPGVLTLSGVPPSWRQQLSVSVLALAGRGLVAGEAAAALHRLDGFPEGPLELCWTGTSNHPPPGVILRRVKALDHGDRFVIDGRPVTGLARTLVDVAWAAPERAERALDDVRRRGTSLAWLRETAERLHRPGQAGTGVLLRLLDGITADQRVRDSWFEALVERCLASPALPPLVRQHEVRDLSGRLVGRLDLAFPSIRLGVEAHSRKHHYGSREAFDEDRDLALAAEGWEVLYVGWQGTREPSRLLALVERTATAKLAA